MANYEDYPTKKGKRWRARIRKKGFPEVNKSGFHTKSEAMTWAVDYERALRTGQISYSVGRNKRTFESLVQWYTETQFPIREQKKDNAKLQSRLDWWRKELGKYYLINVTSEIIEDCKDKLLKTITRKGTPMEGATVRRYLSALGVVMAAAKSRKWIDSNPLKDVQRPRESKERIRILSKNEEKALMDEVKKDEDLHDIVTIALQTGMRRGEIHALKWDNCNFEAELMYFPDTKSGEAIYKPMIPTVKAILERRVQLCEYVFHNAVLNGPLDFDYRWRKARDDAKIKDFRFHDLRHTLLSRLAMRGHGDAELAKVAGHKSVQATRRYTHVDVEHTRKILTDASPSKNESHSGENNLAYWGKRCEQLEHKNKVLRLYRKLDHAYRDDENYHQENAKKNGSRNTKFRELVRARYREKINNESNKINIDKFVKELKNDFTPEKLAAYFDIKPIFPHPITIRNWCKTFDLEIRKEKFQPLIDKFNSNEISFEDIVEQYESQFLEKQTF